jgi:hypothetical protein
MPPRAAPHAGMPLAAASSKEVTMPADRTKIIRLIQDRIDEGATTVEEIHKSIADLPLKILQESELLKGPAKEAKRLQDQTIGAIYDTIRDINERVGTYASKLLADAAKRRSPRAQPAAKARARAAGR